LARFQSYVSCTIILSAAAQRSPEDRDDDLQKAKVCLSALKACSGDHVARVFHQNLSSYYDVIVSITYTQPDGYIHPTQSSGPVFGDISPLSSHDINPQLMTLSLTLLGMLCCPFGDKNVTSSTDESLNEQALGNQLRHDDAQRAKGIERNPKNSGPSQWDVGRTGHLDGQLEVSSTLGLSGSSPRGWLSDSEFMQDLPDGG